MSRTRRTAFALQGKTDSARAFEVTLQDCSRVLPACLPASACEFVRPLVLLPLSVSRRTQARPRHVPVMALCKAEITRHGHTRRTWRINMEINISSTLRSWYIDSENAIFGLAS